MAIDLYLNTSGERAATYLLSLRPDKTVARWEVDGYQVSPRIWGSAIRLSIVATLHRGGEWDVALCSVLLLELDTDRCLLRLASDNPGEPELLLLSWLLEGARRAWPGDIETQLETLQQEMRSRPGSIRGLTAEQEALARQLAARDDMTWSEIGDEVGMDGDHLRKLLKVGARRRGRPAGR